MEEEQGRHKEYAPENRVQTTPERYIEIYQTTLAEDLDKDVRGLLYGVFLKNVSVLSKNCESKVEP